MAWLVGRDPPFHTPVFVLTHHPRARARWRAAPRSTSSPTASRRPTSGDRRGRRQGHQRRWRRLDRAAADPRGLLDELQIGLVPILLGGGRAAVRRGSAARRWARADARARGARRHAPAVPAAKALSMGGSAGRLACGRSAVTRRPFTLAKTESVSVSAGAECAGREAGLWWRARAGSGCRARSCRHARPRQVVRLRARAWRSSRGTDGADRACARRAAARRTAQRPRASGRIAPAAA